MSSTIQKSRSLFEELKGWAQIILVVIFVGGAVAFSILTRPGDPPSKAASDAQLLSVTTMQPGQQSAQLSITATGTVQLQSSVSIVPQVPGKVVRLSPSLRDGGQFKAGEALLVIEPADYQLAVEQAQADVAAAETALALERAEADAAAEEWAVLYPGEPAPDLVARRPQIAQAEARLAGAKARVSDARLDLSRTTISLPFDGFVTEAAIQAGQFVTVGQPVGQAYSLEAVEVVVPLPREDLNVLAPVEGREALITAGNTVLRGTVERRSATVDPITRFASVFVSPDTPEVLTPGEFVDVVLKTEPRDDVMVLPVSAEQQGGDVWIVENSRLQMVTPQVLARSADTITVKAFDYGDGVVNQPLTGGREDLEVNVVTGDAADR